MSRRRTSPWAKAFKRSLTAWTRQSVRAGTRAVGQAIKAQIKRQQAPKGAGDWVAGVAIGMGGARRYHLYRPARVAHDERLPLVVMLHGCGQDAHSFALSTRMNSLAARQRFVVLYPEQDRLANPQGCWHWFDTAGGRAASEADLIMKAIDQACLLYPVDAARVAIAGFSAGAGMAALLATRHPARFKAVVMHSGVPPGSAHSSLSALRAMRGRQATLPPMPIASPATTWPPLLVIHGSADLVVSASNAQAAIQLWADAASAQAGQPRQVQRGQRHAMTVTDFKHRQTLVATLVLVEALGHAWSGGAARQPFSDAKGPDASRLVWAFASRQFAGAGVR